MDLGYGDNGDLDSGEAIMLGNLPSKSGAISSGIIASICLCDGKSTKPLFNYISSHKNVTLTFSAEGLEIIETMVDPNTKAISYVDVIRFKASKQLSYCYCPQNIDGDGDKTSISLTLETQSLLDSVSNNKVGSSVIFEYNKNRKTDLSVTVTHNGRPTTSFKSVVISRANVNPINGSLIVDRKEGGVDFGFGIVSDILSSNMATNSKKHKNTLYGSVLEIFKNGLRIHSKIPKVEPFETGQLTGESISFELTNAITSRLAKLVKISPKTPVFIEANNEMFKINMAACAYAEITTYKFPDVKNTISTTPQGVTNEEMAQFTKYQLELDTYLKGMIDTNQMTREYATQMRTIRLQEVWNFIQNAANERMMKMTGGYQGAQLQKNSVANLQTLQGQGQGYGQVGQGQGQTLQVQSQTSQVQTGQGNGQQLIQQVQKMENLESKMTILKLDSTV